MKRDYPQDKFLLIILFLLGILFFVNLFERIQKDFFISNYDWEKIKEIGKTQEISITDYSYNFIILKGIGKELNPNYTYRLDNSNQQFFFRFVYQEPMGENYRLKNLQWINKIPDSLPDTSTLTPVYLSLKQQGKYSAYTLGDDCIFFNDGKYFRKFLAEDKKLIFMGNSLDVFGFPMVAKINYTLEDLVNISDTIRPADFYFVYMSPDCKKYNLKKQNILLNKLKNTLKKKTTYDIFFITLPETQQKNPNCIKKFNNTLRSLSSEKIIIIDTNDILDLDNEENFLSNKKYISKQALKKIIKEINKKIK